MNVIDRVELVEKQLDALITRAEIWQLIFDECPIAIACFDFNMRFFMVNKEFFHLSGFDSSIIGEKIKIVIPSKQKKEHSKYEKYYAKNPVPKVNRHGLSPQILDVNGELIDVDISLSFIEHQGKPYYIAFLKRI